MQFTRIPYSRLLPFLLFVVVGCAEGGQTSPPAGLEGDAQRLGGSGAPADVSLGQHGGLSRRGHPPKAGWAVAPRNRRKEEVQTGLRCSTDGKLDEWKDAKWLEIKAEADGKNVGRWAYGSYGRGLCLAIFVRDATPKTASVAAALSRSDHVAFELKLPSRLEGKVLRWRLGSERKLVSFSGAADRWREALVSANGTKVAGGYVLEARIPLAALTPFRAKRLVRANLSVVLFDADPAAVKNSPAKKLAAQRHELNFVPALEVPLPVQQRVSARICHGAFDNAFWSYDNGWRCSLAEEKTTIAGDDTASRLPFLAHIRIPEPPRIPTIAERLVVFNFLGGFRGGLALVDPKEKIYSILHLGVVGRSDPGNARVKLAEVKPFKLPDGDWAVRLVHSYFPPRVACASAPETFLSIVALRDTTIGKPIARTSQPYLEEIFRHPLNSCNTLDAWDWQLRSAGKRIDMRSLLKPSTGNRRFDYDKGRYRPTTADTGNE